MSYEDKNLTCVECNSEFTYTADDQQFHASKGYTEPKRCPSCRSARRNSGGGGGSSYGSGGGYSSYGGGGDSYRQQREMFPATCAECNKQTQVPFQPRGDKPVYCSDCFSKRSASTSRRY
ncbi:MAG: CxxC-x17-CxxC domain-containing protein [Chloroflexota bacterium]